MNEKVSWKAFGIVMSIIVGFMVLIIGGYSTHADRLDELVRQNTQDISNVGADISQIRTDIQWIKNALINKK
jgi:hypothetical protein